MNQHLPRRPFVTAYLVLPLVVLLLFVAWGLLVLLPALPSTVASHWGWSGAPDGFSSPSSLIVQMVALLGGIAVVMGAVSVRMRLSSLGASAVLLTGFTLALLLDVLWPQRGLSEHQVQEFRSAWLPGLLTMIVFVAAAALLNRWVRRATLAALEEDHRQLLSGSPRRVWEEHSRRIPWWILALAVPGAAVGFLSPAAAILVLGLMWLSIESGALLSPLRLELFDAALVLRSPEPMVYALQDIHRVDALKHIGFWDAGGYGIRYTGSAVFIIPHAGNAIRLHTDTQPVSIVVPDGQAAEIAAEISEMIKPEGSSA